MTARLPHAKSCIALIGARGCGKSAVGRELAMLWDCAFLDTDELVVERTGRSIAAIFADEGEAAFREYEVKAIAEALGVHPGIPSPHPLRQRGRGVSERTLKVRPAVIAVGGGAVMAESNVELLQSAAVLVWLTAPAEVLWQRIFADPATPDSRPALTDVGGLAEVREILQDRTPRYAAAADLVVDTAGKPVNNIAREIAAALRRPPGP